MYYLIILLEIVLFITLSLRLNSRHQKIGLAFESNQKIYHTLLNQYQESKNLNNTLTENVQNLIELYETTKELTKYSTFDEVFFAFRQRLSRVLFFLDCQFLKPNADSLVFEGYCLFPIQENGELIGQLAVKGLDEKDLERFHILFNQFILVLRRVRLYSKVEELSITDSLTQVFLRRYFQERLEEEIKRSFKFNLKFALLMLDLDRFKTYNDRYGHLVGDVILCEVAAVIKNNIRSIDVAARYGGEEFSFILPDTDSQEANFVSLRLLKAIEKKHICAYDEELQITASIGGVVFPSDATDAQELIDKADQALYRAKQEGRNRACFYER